jgi:hypothetical protein
VTLDVLEILRFAAIDIAREVEVVVVFGSPISERGTIFE